MKTANHVINDIVSLCVDDIGNTFDTKRHVAYFAGVFFPYGLLAKSSFHSLSVSGFSLTFERGCGQCLFEQRASTNALTRSCDFNSMFAKMLDVAMTSSFRAVSARCRLPLKLLTFLAATALQRFGLGFSWGLGDHSIRGKS